MSAHILAPPAAPLSSLLQKATQRAHTEQFQWPLPPVLAAAWVSSSAGSSRDGGRANARGWRVQAVAIDAASHAVEGQAAPDAASSGASVALVALGCPKNTVDAEVMLGDLRRQGYQIIEDPEEADVIIVNTCAFIEDAKKESIDAIMDAGQLKNRKARGLFVTGCLAQRYAQELATELPDVDAVVGFESYSQIGPQITRVLEERAKHTELGGEAGTSSAPQQSVLVGTPHVPFRSESERWRIGERHTAYLRVAEGCDHSCTFCSIPGFRGKFRSKGFEAVFAEAKLLVASGARELCLIAEDTNQWGMDFGERDPRRLPELLYALNEIPKLKWIRLLYCYPSYFTEELIDAIANMDKVCKYIDIPLQHMSDSVLRRMQRPGRKHTEALLTKLRERIPGLVLRTTFIAGFPGEAKAEHEEVVNFVHKFGFERGGVFAYSEEDGTPAAEFEGQLAKGLKNKRRTEIADLMLNRQLDWAESQIGRVLDVMIDKMEGNVAIGRTQYDAPEIDNEVHIEGCFVPFTRGSVLRCRVVATDFLDLIAEPVEDK